MCARVINRETKNDFFRESFKLKNDQKWFQLVLTTMTSLTTTGDDIFAQLKVVLAEE